MADGKVTIAVEVQGNAKEAFDKINKSLDTLTDRLNLVKAGVGVWAEVARFALAGAAAHERQQTALRSLGAAYDQVHSATAGAIGAADAFRAQQDLLQSGIRLSGTDLATVARAARDYARATGTDATQAMGQLTDALRGGEAEGLRRFGVSLADGSTRASALSQAMRQLADQQARSGPAARTAAEAQEQLARAWKEASDELGALIAQEGGLNEFVVHFTDWLRDLTSGARSFSAEVGNMARAIVGLQSSVPDARQEHAQASRQRFADEYGRLRREAREAGVDVSGLPALAGPLATGLSEARREQLLAALRAESRTASRFGGSITTDARAQARVDAAMRGAGLEVVAVPEAAATVLERLQREQAGEAAAAARANRTTVAQRRGGGGGTDPWAELRSRGTAAAMADITRREAQRLADAEHERAWAAQQADAMIAEGEQTRENERGKAAAQSAVDEAAKAEASRQTELERTRTFTGQLTSLFAEQETSGQRAAKGIRAAFDGMASAMGSHIDAVVQGRESLGVALQGMLSDTLGSIAKEAATRAGMSAALALFSLATGNFASAATYGAAAAGFTAVAALAGAGAAATKPGTASAGAASTPAAARASGGTLSGGGGPVNVTIVYGAGVLSTPRDLAQHVAGVLNGGAVMGGVRLNPRLVGGVS